MRSKGAVGPANRDGFAGVAVENGVGGLNNLGLDNGAWGVELRGGSAGIDFWCDAEVGGEGAGGAEVTSRPPCSVKRWNSATPVLPCHQ